MDQTMARAEAATRAWRRAMVDNQIRTYDVTDARVLDQFYRVPREAFLPDQLAGLAYSDAVLTVPRAGSAGRAVLVPMILARMLQGADIRSSETVLVVGGAMGYPAALIAALCTSVTTLESDDALTKEARERLLRWGASNADAVTGPLQQGHAAGAPYDVIIVAGAVESGFESLFAQLAPGGRLLAIRKGGDDGIRRSGKAMIFERINGEVSARGLFDASCPVLDGFQTPAAFVF